MNGATPTRRQRIKLIAGRIYLCLFLVLFSLAMQAVVRRHPQPVLPDESEFIAALGFPRPYPVHAPGYPLWIALGTLAHAAGLDPYSAYRVWSLVACCLGPLVFYFSLTRRGHRDDPVVYTLALCMAANPLWCFHGATALNYSTAVLLSIPILSLARRAIVAESMRPTWLAAVLLAVAAGLRFDMLLWFGPAVLFSAFATGWSPFVGKRRIPVRELVGTAAILAAAAVGWTLVGRWLYSDAAPPTIHHTLAVLRSTSVLERGFVNGLVRNLVKMTAYLGWGFGLASVPLIWALYRLLFHDHVIVTNVGRPASADRQPQASGSERGQEHASKLDLPADERPQPLSNRAERRLRHVPDRSSLGTDKCTWRLAHDRNLRCFDLLVLLPLLLFQLFVHVTEAGHVLWYVPFGYAILERELAFAFPWRLRPGPVFVPDRRPLLFLFVVFILSSFQFLAYPWSANVTGWRRTLNAKVAYLSGSGLMQIDQRRAIHQPNDFWTVPP
ncbi:MAG: hypothetical protein U1A27_13770 [Phycisphaerae bacterium]